MTYDLLSALAAFAFVTSITPGPNNLMLMTSGANFGFRRSIPHMLGVGLGFVFMVVLVVWVFWRSSDETISGTARIPLEDEKTDG